MTPAIVLGIVGPWQLAIVVLVVILLFGGKKIPELMKGIGQGINEFKKARNEATEEDKTKIQDSKKLKE